jgi:hypothetical protein
MEVDTASAAPGGILSWLKGFFVPVPAQDLRPDPQSGEGRYVRSFLVMRLFIGFIGVLLPFALVFIDHWWFHGYPWPRGSESIYYYSGMREAFTVSIGVIAFFMFAYKITERNLDNTLSFFAGVAGLLIVAFPTAPPALIQKGFTTPTNPVPPDLTPLQKSLTEPTTHTIHQFTSGAFILFLGLTAITFGIREGQRTKRYDHPHFGPTFWRNYHWGMAGLMLAAAVWILFTMKIYQGPYWSLLVGEGTCAFAFGASWTAKGAEWRYLFGRSTAAEKTARAELAQSTSLESPTKEILEVPPGTGTAPASG